LCSPSAAITGKVRLTSAMVSMSEAGTGAWIAATPNSLNAAHQ